MTTGSITTGSLSSDSYFHKNWSGVDGKRQPNGLLKENPYSMSLQIRHRSKGSQWQNPTKSCILPSYYIDCSVVQYPRDDNSYNSALANLGQNIKDTSFNLGTFGAQGRMEYEQAINTCGAIGNALGHLRHGDFRAAARNLGLVPGQRRTRTGNDKLKAGDISGAWLAMQYGWLPTLSDLYEAWQLQDKILKPRVNSYKGKSKRVLSYDSSTSPSNWSCTARSKVMTMLKCTMTEDVSWRQQLSLNDPLTVAWEMTPWSFVIDWFYPIGTFLEAASAMPFVTKGGITTVFKRMESSLGLIRNQSFNYQGHPNYCGGSDSYKTVQVDRTIGAFVARAPKFVPPSAAMSPARIYNAIALAHQRALGIVPPAAFPALKVNVDNAYYSRGGKVKFK